MQDYNGLFIADLHIGAMSVERTKKEINKLKDYLDNHFFSFIIIGGDFWDNRLYLNEEYVTIGLELMLFLTLCCAKLRFIEGTKSHDNNQYNIFKPLLRTEPACDVKIITSVMEEDLFDDLKVLYIPEEYVYDKKEYYKEFFNEDDRYDYIFGHGIIQEGMFHIVRHIGNDRQKRRKPPVFNVQELNRVCKGKVYFGHYHVFTNINDKAFYSGSYSRYKFGEEEDKGFLELYLKDGEYSEKFIVNENTEKYITLSFPCNHSIFKDNTDIMKEFNKIKEKKEILGIEHIKLIFNIPDEYSDTEYFIRLANETFNDDESIKLEINNGYIKNKRMVNKKKFNEAKEKYEYVFDTNEDNIYDVVSNFSRDKYDREISPEKVKKYFQFRAIDLINGGED